MDSNPSLSYLIMRIITRTDGTRVLSQSRQINILNILPTKCDYSKYRSALDALAWLQQTRLYVFFAISMAARITDRNFNQPEVAAHSATVKYLHNMKHLELKFPHLDQKSLRIAVCVDAGHHNLLDGHRHLVYVVFFADKSNRCCFLTFSSRKPRRIVHSTTGEEALAFADGFDAFFAIRADLSRANNRQYLSWY